MFLTHNSILRMFVSSFINVFFSWRNWNCVTDLFHGQVDDLYNVCVSEILATTVWTWWWAADWVWRWTHVLLSTTPLSCSDSPYLSSCSKVYQQFSLPLVSPATRIKNSCFFFFLSYATLVALLYLFSLFPHIHSCLGYVGLLLIPSRFNCFFKRGCGEDQSRTHQDLRSGQN